MIEEEKILKFDNPIRYLHKIGSNSNSISLPTLQSMHSALSGSIRFFPHQKRLALTGPFILVVTKKMIIKEWH
jgi:hypothetical protein